jgi:hypothetical protein
MFGLDERYDRLSKNFSLNSGILYLLSFALPCFLAAFEGNLGSRNHDSLWYAGAITLLIGVIGILHAVQIIRAVVRRLVAESSSPGTPRLASETWDGTDPN